MNLSYKKDCFEKQSFLYLVKRVHAAEPRFKVSEFQGLKQRSVKQPEGRETFQLLEQHCSAPKTIKTLSTKR